MTSEAYIEQRLRKQVEQRGGLCLKFVSPGCSGVPDRLALMPGGRLAFIEVKRPGAKPRKLQELRHKQLRGLGFPVYVVDSLDSVEMVLHGL